MCNKDLFYQNAQIIAQCKSNEIFDNNARIYNIVYSNSGNNNTDIGRFAKKTTEKFFDKGLWETTKDIFKNIGKKLLGEKVALILTDKIVVAFNIDKIMYHTFTLYQAAEFAYKKDDYMLNVVDIFENNMSDEALLENVSASLYRDFYTKLTELINISISAPLPTLDKKSKLLELKELFEEGLIDEDEYKAQKQIVLNN